MEFNLLRLNNNLDKYIPINLTYSFTKEELKKNGILEISNIKIVGEITKDSLDQIELNIDVSGIVVLPCAITLNPIDYPINIKIDGTLEDLMGENEEIVKKDENTLDILPIIWENILMEIPMRVVSPGAEDNFSKLEGNGWKVITDDAKENVNPELAKLKDLL